MLNILKNWIKRFKCKHEYQYLCSGESTYMVYRFNKCKYCGKSMIESFEK